MIKTIITTLIAAVLLIGVGIFEQHQVKKQFKEFEDALSTLYYKTLNDKATKQDAEAVKELWNNEKETLHIYIPHSDIEYIDYWIGEAVSLIYTKNYDDALSKIEVLIDISKNTPASYTLNLQNIF